jgi:hypothetical protein
MPLSIGARSEDVISGLPVPLAANYATSPLLPSRRCDGPEASDCLRRAIEDQDLECVVQLDGLELGGCGEDDRELAGPKGAAEVRVRGTLD